MILLSLNYSPSPISLRLFSRSGKIENHESAISDLLIRLDSKFYLATRHQLFSKFGKTSKKESTWRPRATVLFFLLLSLSPCPSLFFSLSFSDHLASNLFPRSAFVGEKPTENLDLAQKSSALLFTIQPSFYNIKVYCPRERERVWSFSRRRKVPIKNTHFRRTPAELTVTPLEKGRVHSTGFFSRRVWKTIPGVSHDVTGLAVI